MDNRIPRLPTKLDDTQPAPPQGWIHPRKSKLPPRYTRYTPPQPRTQNKLIWLGAALGLILLIASSYSRTIFTGIQVACATIGCFFVLAFIFLLVLFRVIPILR